MTFAAPWMLWGLCIVPLVWWWTRHSTDRHSVQTFPPMRLVLHLSPPHQDPPRDRPWWLWVLRMIWVACLSIWAAQPIIPASSSHHALGQPDQMVGIILDDGWGAAPDWAARITDLDQRLAEAHRRSQQVFLVRTAPGWDGVAEPVIGPIPAAQMRTILPMLTPKPWPTQRSLILPSLHHSSDAALVWICDGWHDQGSSDILALRDRLHIVTGTLARRITGVSRDDTGWKITLRPSGAIIQAWDGQGHLIASGPDTQPLVMPTALSNRLARLSIANERSAAAVFVLDRGWYRPKVGVVREDQDNAPLLSDGYYIRHALSESADLVEAPLDKMVLKPLSALIISDGIDRDQGREADILRWVQAGGVLIRFAGPQLSEQSRRDDPLLPLSLRPGTRSLGGSLSWSDSLTLGSFAATGPLSSLASVRTSDLVVARQSLADPADLRHDRIWASLSDGTPLVSGTAEGQGWVVLVHVAANPSWSNLPLSGLLPDILTHLTRLGHGGSGSGVGGDTASPTQPRAASQVLDAFGQWRSKMPQSIPPKIAGLQPPGLYGDRIVNLGPQIGDLQPLDLSSIPHQSVDGQSQDVDLRPPFMMVALLLWGVDLLVRLGWTGRWRGRHLPLMGLLLVMWTATPGYADDTLRWGLLVGSDHEQAGLDRISILSGQRSHAALLPSVRVSADHDDLVLYPLLYWSLSASDAALSPKAIQKLNHYMRTGGILVCAGSSGRLAFLAPGLRVPPLHPVTSQHPLSRTFYLLRDEDPLLAEQAVRAAEPFADSDGVSALILAPHDLARRWADAPETDKIHAIGLNLILYALTGTYKTDQIHMDKIKDRLSQ